MDPLLDHQVPRRYQYDEVMKKAKHYPRTASENHLHIKWGKAKERKEFLKQKNNVDTKTSKYKLSLNKFRLNIRRFLMKRQFKFRNNLPIK